MKQYIVRGFLMISGSIMITGGIIAIEISTGASDAAYLLVIAGFIHYGLAFLSWIHDKGFIQF